MSAPRSRAARRSSPTALLLEITANPGETFLDRMIALVEGAARQKTPNEIALNILISGLTLIFLIVVVTLQPFAIYSGHGVSVTSLIALLVALIPTTIGALLSAIGIAGMDRLVQRNVLAMSGRAVEAAGDIDVLLLDKTGTITYGNRLAAEFIPVGGHTRGGGDRCRPPLLAGGRHAGGQEHRRAGGGARLHRRSPDARHRRVRPLHRRDADERRSRLDGRSTMKGAVDAVLRQAADPPADLQTVSDRIAGEGGTPLAVMDNGEVLGVIYLKDTVKPHIRERFAEMRRIGIRTIMITGDNPLTAATIAREAGVDDFVAEAKPEDKIRIIRENQSDGRLVGMTGDGTNDAPALAQADVGVAMNTGTAAAKEAGNMVDLDSDPTKILDIVAVGKQLLMTRGALTTFSIANDVAKYFAILPAMFAATYPELNQLNVMHLKTPQSAIAARSSSTR